ncbi:MAG: anthranilate synthase component I family protein, partial [Halobacteriales archaeon]
AKTDVRHVEHLDLTADPVDVYEALDADVLLEPLDRGWRHAVVAFDAVDSIRLHESDDDGWRRLRDWAPEPVAERTSTGAYGYVAYDACRWQEDVPDLTRRDVDLPVVAYGLYDTTVVVSDDGLTIEAIEHPRQRQPPGRRVRRTRKRLESHLVRPSREPPEIDARDVEWNYTEEEYREAVRRAKRRIREGDSFQVNLSQRLSYTSEVEAVDLYRALRRTNPAPYMGLLETEHGAVVSTSPELLLRKRGRRLTTRPIAGTRPLGDGEERHVNRRDLLASEKDRAEHSILLDLARNDLGSVAEIGSVEVERTMEAVEYEEVTHLESLVTAETDEDAVTSLAAVFPGGTVTGAPKPRTLEIIEELEPTRRGPYTGAMGRLGFDGDAEHNIIIRSVVVDGDRHHLQVGGGVVHDSEPEAEYRETLDKAQGVLNALER